MQRLCKNITIKSDKKQRFGYVNKFRNLEVDVSEKALWRAVICQAVEDAISESNKKSYKIQKHKATSWLINEQEDFEMVCDLAGYEACDLRKYIKNLIK